MKKVRLIIEAEIDEKELKNVISSQNSYGPLSEEEYIDGMEFRIEQGRLILFNPIEEHFNDNEGKSECIKNPKLVSKEMIE